jgi:hypothetical protein
MGHNARWKNLATQKHGTTRSMPSGNPQAASSVITFVSARGAPAFAPTPSLGALHEVAQREGVTVPESTLQPADRKRIKISQRRRDGEFSHSLQEFRTAAQLFGDDPSCRIPFYAKLDERTRKVGGINSASLVRHRSSAVSVCSGDILVPFSLWKAASNCQLLGFSARARSIL